MREVANGLQIADVHSGDHDLRYTSTSGAANHVIPVGVELRRVEVAVRVYPARHSSNDARNRGTVRRAQDAIAW